MPEEVRVDEIVDEDDVALTERFGAAQREEARISGPRADQVSLAVHHDRDGGRSSFRSCFARGWHRET
jgi:hypothetical protein